MNPDTASSYRKLAIHFYKTKLGKEHPASLKEVREALLIAAPDYRPGYFRRVKNALALDLRERGHDQAATKLLAVRNPVTKPGSKLPKKAKLLREKRFRDEDYSKLARALVGYGYVDEFAALTLIWFTGIRPAELRKTRAMHGRIFIEGAKQSHNGKRGADRILVPVDPNAYPHIEKCIQTLRESERSVAAIRDRLRCTAKALWPRRKVLPTMYSMRHQIGANLKASELDPRTIAYIMGHQSTNSIATYGNRRQGNPRAIQVMPAVDAELAHIRKKFSERAQNWISNAAFQPDA